MPSIPCGMMSKLYTEGGVMKKLLITATILFCMSGSVKASDVASTTIKEVAVGPLFGNNVFIALSSIPTDSPTCHTNSGYSYVFDASTESGKITLSVVLAAYATKTNIKIGGISDCVIYNGVENLNYIGSK